jgi:hypothetical protein
MNELKTFISSTYSSLKVCFWYYILAINTFVSQEEFTYYFGCDFINFDEFLYLEFIVYSRSHYENNEIIIVFELIN